MKELEITEIPNPSYPIQITLNGYLINDADDKVRKFRYGRESDDTSKTNIWISKSLFHNIYLLLKQENADGIRFYFASDDDGNNIMLVSTRDGGPDPDDTTKSIHLDYFEHVASFLGDIQNNAGDIIIDHGPAGNGALLYNFTSPCAAYPDCVFYPVHDLHCDDAYARVKNYSLAKSDINNTISEWFEMDFIERLDEELQQSSGANALDGIRIYYGKREEDDRLVFIIVSTINNGGIHEDYYGCFQPPHFTDDNGEQCPPNCKGKLLGGG